MLPNVNALQNKKITLAEKKLKPKLGKSHLKNFFHTPFSLSQNDMWEKTTLLVLKFTNIKIIDYNPKVKNPHNFKC